MKTVDDYHHNVWSEYNRVDKEDLYDMDKIILTLEIINKVRCTRHEALILSCNILQQYLQRYIKKEYYQESLDSIVKGILEQIIEEEANDTDND